MIIKIIDNDDRKAKILIDIADVRTTKYYFVFIRKNSDKVVHSRQSIKRIEIYDM